MISEEEMREKYQALWQALVDRDNALRISIIASSDAAQIKRLKLERRSLRWERLEIEDQFPMFTWLPRRKK